MSEVLHINSGFCKPKQEYLAEKAVLLREFAIGYDEKVRAGIKEVTSQSPFRHMVTPGGFTMSVAMTNCGKYGWVSEQNGYRYDVNDPLTGKHWPEIPDPFLNLAIYSAAEAGFDNFIPDVCLINRYQTGTKLTLHRDKDELDFNQPIVSVSLGVPAIFLFGGLKRSDRAKRINLYHGDVVVWGGPDRLRYHGILPLKDASHNFMEKYRINLTFRKAR